MAEDYQQDEDNEDLDPFSGEKVPHEERAQEKDGAEREKKNKGPKGSLPQIHVMELPAPKKKIYLPKLCQTQAAKGIKDLNRGEENKDNLVVNEFHTGEKSEDSHAKTIHIKKQRKSLKKDINDIDLRMRTIQS